MKARERTLEAMIALRRADRERTYMVIEADARCDAVFTAINAEIAEAVAAERERCAVLVGEWLIPQDFDSDDLRDIAAAIRGEK